MDTELKPRRLAVRIDGRNYTLPIDAVEFTAILNLSREIGAGTPPIANALINSQRGCEFDKHAVQALIAWLERIQVFAPHNVDVGLPQVDGAVVFMQVDAATARTTLLEWLRGPTPEAQLIRVA